MLLSYKKLRNTVTYNSYKHSCNVRNTSHHRQYLTTTGTTAASENVHITVLPITTVAGALYKVYTVWWLKLEWGEVTMLTKRINTTSQTTTHKLLHLLVPSVINCSQSDWRSLFALRLHILQQEHTHSANSAKAAAMSCRAVLMSNCPILLRPLQQRPLVSDNILYIKCPSPSVKESEKLILDPHPDQYQKWFTSGGSPMPIMFGWRLLMSSTERLMLQSHNSANQSLGGLINTCIR